MRLLSVATIACALLFPTLSLAAEEGQKETTFERVMRTNTLHCGYYIWPPFMMKDPNTGALSGLGYDVFEEVGKQLNLKIEWTTEISFDAMFEGYASGRYDMICLPLTASPARARASDFTIPVGYAAYYLYAKDGDTRFDNNYKAADDAHVKYASLDGDMNSILGQQVFPSTQKLAQPQNSTNIDVLMMVAGGKADITTMEPVPANAFMKANPGKIRQVSGPPVRVMPINYSIPLGDVKLKSMIDITLQSLLDIGSIDQILAKYPEYNETILRIHPVYNVSK